jgi:hypothetical protein
VQIEHAIFTSARTGRNEGYQFVAASPRIARDQQRELAAWCPSHNGLLPSAAVSGGISFFRTASGSYYVTRTLADGNEYSGRGGPRLVTHCLSLPEELLGRFANNPFAVLDAAVAGGHLDVSHALKGDLEPFSLVGRARAFDRVLLRAAERRHGQRRLVELLTACCTANRVGFVSGPETAKVVAALLNLLPVSTRTEISFAIGLRPTTCRPVRWLSLEPDDLSGQRQLQRDGIAFIDSCPDGDTLGCRGATNPAKESTASAWAAFVTDCLTRDQLDRLEAAIAEEGCASPSSTASGRKRNSGKWRDQPRSPRVVGEWGGGTPDARLARG